MTTHASLLAAGQVHQLDSHPHSHPFGGLPSLSHLTPSSLLKFLHSPTINDFHFVIGETPLSTWATPLVVIPCYLLAIVATQRLVAWRGKPFDLRAVFFIHNAFLALGSLALFIPLVYDVATLMYQHGVWEVFCDGGSHYYYGRHYWIYYVRSHSPLPQQVYHAALPTAAHPLFVLCHRVCADELHL